MSKQSQCFSSLSNYDRKNYAIHFKLVYLLLSVKNIKFDSTVFTTPLIFQKKKKKHTYRDHLYATTLIFPYTQT